VRAGVTAAGAAGVAAVGAGCGDAQPSPAAMVVAKSERARDASVL